MKKLLIVVDMQEDFISGSLGTQEALVIVHRSCLLHNDVVGYVDLTTRDGADTAVLKNRGVVGCQIQLGTEENGGDGGGDLQNHLGGVGDSRAVELLSREDDGVQNALHGGVVVGNGG